MKLTFSSSCSSLIRYEISQANNNEVFFIADCNLECCVIAVEAVARGNKNAVSAVISRARAGQILLHNHPSGDLTPSDADLDIASVAGNNSIGFAIINNSCDDCYLVVTPHQPQDYAPLDLEEVARAFGTSGALAKHLQGYEERKEQVQMAQAVADSFNNSGVALIEAGTGTGKSLAYLIPSIIWAVRNDQRVVISTNTINLQEQLIKKDIPLLQRNSTIEFTACLLKGRGNYLCKRKMTAAETEPALFPDAASEELNAIAGWAENSHTGCLSDIGFQPSWEVWDNLRCEGDQCSRSRCSHFQKCFFYRAKREAASARVLVVNHALLLADIALRQDNDDGYDAVSVLPVFERLIIDEGHHLEEAATKAYSAQISRAAIMRQLARLVSTGAKSGILTVLNNRIGRDLPEHLEGLYQELSAIIETALQPQTMELAALVDKELDWLAKALQEREAGDDLRGHEVRRRITPLIRETPFWNTLCPKLLQLAEKFKELGDGLGNLNKAAAKLPDQLRMTLDSWLTDAAGIGLRLVGVADTLTVFCSSNEDYCHWLELKKTGQSAIQPVICTAPLEVANLLHKSMFESLDTVVVTSATMTVGNSFAYQRKRIGLDLLASKNLSELLLPSPFDFSKQSVIGIPSDMPDPSGRAFTQAVIDAVLQALVISRGGAFVLFTSFELLRTVSSALKADLERLGLTVLRQGEGSGRHQLLARFRKEKNAVLFGTDSFWEGVDVKGDALRLVIITRLPFQVPTEPIQQARAELVTSRGGDPFRELSLPQAVLKLRQGFGRLIRSNNDRGAVLILDSRIVSKNYGSRFFKSLPAAAQIIAPAKQVFMQLKDFFGESR
ncbi:MAG: helicase C-terminal domain-containing protein [Trichlorobacter sp.]|nr:helicase C-terminal domain-containing protein [Trichlorobacter sp.]